MIGRDSSGYTVGEMMEAVVSELKKQEAPLLILDEADKLNDNALYFFIALYNQLEDECGIVLQATNYLEKRLARGVRLNKKGYNEIWSRVGRKCIELKGVTADDIASICVANGVHDAKTIDKIIDDSESDLRRVKRRVHAVSKSRAAVIKRCLNGDKNGIKASVDTAERHGRGSKEVPVHGRMARGIRHAGGDGDLVHLRRFRQRKDIVRFNAHEVPRRVLKGTVR